MTMPRGGGTPALSKEEEDKQHEDTSFDAEVASHALSLRGRKLTVSIAIVAGTGFTLFGFVQIQPVQWTDAD
jgi:hypothetical protein